MNDPNKDNQEKLNDDLELYKLLIDQVHHKHTRWVDNRLGSDNSGHAVAYLWVAGEA